MVIALRLALTTLPVAALALGPLHVSRGSWSAVAAALWAGCLCAFLFSTGAASRPYAFGPANRGVGLHTSSCTQLSLLDSFPFSKSGVNGSLRSSARLRWIAIHPERVSQIQGLYIAT